jgi:hypothetical protein
MKTSSRIASLSTDLGLQDGLLFINIKVNMEREVSIKIEIIQGLDIN